MEFEIELITPRLDYLIKTAEQEYRDNGESEVYKMILKNIEDCVKVHIYKTITSFINESRRLNPSIQSKLDKLNNEITKTLKDNE